jgi:hypothetical protein
VNAQERIRLERQQLREEYGDLFDEVAAILFEIDPAGINFEFNSDEYEPEVGTILPRLKSCHSVDDVRQVVHQEFAHWFDDDIAGPETHYQDAAERIWATWQRYQQ